MTPFMIAVIAAVVLLLGIIVFPLVNRHSFKKLLPDQKVRVLMKQAKGMNYFKNVSNGRDGVLYYVKNKRKILELPWVLADGKLLCTRKDPFEHWDYPEEKESLNTDELKQLSDALENYNKKNAVKIVFKAGQ